MFDPVRAFLVGRAELAGVWGVGALGDEAFEDFGVPVFIEILQALPIVREVGCGEWALKKQRAICWWRHAIKLPPFKPFACFSAWVYCICEQELAFVVGGLVGSEVVEDDETPAPEVVAPLQGFAVEPFHFGWQVGVAEGFEHGGKLILDREALAAPVPHTACGRMDEGAPAVDFGFVGPLPAFGAGEV